MTCVVWTQPASMTEIVNGKMKDDNLLYGKVNRNLGGYAGARAKSHACQYYCRSLVVHFSAEERAWRIEVASLKRKCANFPSFFPSNPEPKNSDMHLFSTSLAISPPTSGAPYACTS